MTWMNEYDIDHTVETLSHYAPKIAPYAVYLRDWKDTVNANSDGWAYWKAGSGCAGTLSRLLQQAMDNVRGHGEMPAESAFAKSLRTIKAAATRHKLPAPELQAPKLGPEAGIRPGA